jgi:signal transduction histidine kinase
MTRLRPLFALVGLVSLGAAGALVVAALLGMSSSELARLAVLLVPAIAGTVAVALVASWVLRRISLSQRYLAIGAIGTIVALANLLVLTRMMLVSAHAATVLAVVLTYATAAGLATAYSSARDSSAALARITTTAEVIGRGDLAARVGWLGADPDLDRLGSTLDRMADALQRSRDQEQRVERTRRDLITAVSHDLRTPLANLQAISEAIDDGVVDDPPTVRRYAGEMRRAVERLSSLVDDLFELVQVDALSIGTEADRVPLRAVVSSAVATVEAEADRKGVGVRTDVRDPEDTDCSLHLRRVLQNLLVNAVRHTPPGGDVRLEARRSNGELRLVVSDTGEGIPSEDLPHVFDPFYRVDASRAGNGAGLGLALADRIVRALGGEITVASERQRGTSFDVAVPLEVQAQPFVTSTG